MKLVVVCFWFLCGIAGWRFRLRRRFMDADGAGDSPIGRVETDNWEQTMLHKWCPGCLAGMLQWYGLFFLGFCALMAFTYTTHASLFLAHWRSDDLPPLFRWVSKASLVAGVIGFLILSAHFVYAALKGREWRGRQGRVRKYTPGVCLPERHPWAPSRRQDMVFCVLSVPAVYIAMSVQSTIRMWMVLTFDYGPYGRPSDLALYKENLALCAACEYYVVWVFAKLCWKFIRERTSKDTRLITKFAGFQGVHAFVLVGIVQCGLSFGMAYVEARTAEQVFWKAFMEQYGTFLRTACSKVDDLLAAMTILCIYNMVLICRFQPIQEALGNANLKFLGVRMLLMLRVIQPKVLHASVVQRFLGLDLTPDSAARPNSAAPMESLNDDLSKLMHSSLLTLECLVVIMFNLLSWQFGSNTELLYDARSLKERNENDNDNEERTVYQLLDNG